MTPPTLPGDLPGLLRRGSPVVTVGDFWLEHDLWPHGASGVVRDVGQEDVEVTVWHEQHGRATVALLDSAFALDLSDPTGRAHAAWWLARQAGIPDATDAGFPVALAGVFWVMDRAIPGLWYVGTASLRHNASYVGNPRGLLNVRYVPGLLDLDPYDTARLPDGSRWVDAEALRRACLAVAGRA